MVTGGAVVAQQSAESAAVVGGAVVQQAAGGAAFLQQGDAMPEPPASTGTAKMAVIPNASKPRPIINCFIPFLPLPTLYHVVKKCKYHYLFVNFR